VLVAQPGLVGAERLAPVAPPVARAGVRERAPAFAIGTGPGGPVLVACSTGVDLDLVPAAADARAAVAEGLAGGRPAGRDGAAVRLLLAVPEGDDHPVTRRLAAALREPATVVTVPRGWRELTG
jgi:hypothetical protein